jgi:hypothetical protein
MSRLLLTIGLTTALLIAGALVPARSDIAPGKPMTVDCCARA